MHTADEALSRGLTLLAVPGSIRSPASAGTNALLAAGATVARDLDDVLTAVGLGGVRRPPPRRPSLQTGRASRVRSGGRCLRHWGGIRSPSRS